MATKTNKELFCDGLLNLLGEQQVDVHPKACESTNKGMPAHKLILSGRSKVFRKMFESDIDKASTKLETITLSEFKLAELVAFVEFIYSNGSVLSVEQKKHAMSLYRAADKYEIPHLRDLCRDTLLAAVNSSNALTILELAEIPFDKALSEVALAVIRSNQNTIFSSAEFKVFANNHPNLTVEIVNAIMTNSGTRSRYCNYCGRYCHYCGR